MSPDNSSDPAWESGEVDRPICHVILLEPFGMFQDACNSQRFFEDLQTHFFAVAVQRLVTRSCYQDLSLNALTQPQILDDDISFFFRIARFVFKTGPQQQHLLAGVLTGFERPCGLFG